MKTTVVILAACSLSFGIGLFAGRITAPMSEARPAFDSAGNAISEALQSHEMVPDGEATAGQVVRWPCFYLPRKAGVLWLLQAALCTSPCTGPG